MKFLDLTALRALPLLLAGIIGGLLRAADLREARAPALVAIFEPLRRRLRRLQRRFSVLIELLVAGKLPRAARVRAASDVVPPVRTRSARMKRGSAWLFAAVQPDTAHAAGQLQAFMCRPEVRALVTEIKQAEALLRPLCKLLHLSLEPELGVAFAPSRPVMNVVRDAFGRFLRRVPLVFPVSREYEGPPREIDLGFMRR